MNLRKLFNLIVIASILISIPMASSSVKPASAQTSIFTDFASFEAATGRAHRDRL